MSELLKLFRAARRVSCPLIAIKTPDPAATMATIINGFNGNAPAILAWDIARGIYWKNDEGMKTVWSDLLQKPETEPFPESDADKAALAEKIGQDTQNPFEAIMISLRLPKKALLFMANLQRVLPDNPTVSQALWNLRDVFKLNWRTLVMTCPDVTFPAELGQDVLILDEPLPNPAELGRIVKSQYVAAGLVDKKGKADQAASISEEDLSKAVDALSGLAAFPAEQVTAMSLTKDGLDLEQVRARTNAMLDSAPGLSINRSKSTFADLGGLSAIKDLLGRLCTGRKQPRLFVRLEEIEKMFAGTAGDNTGVSQEYLGAILTFMQDRNANGLIAVGVPGAGKSEISNAAGNTFGIRTINCDLGAMKASLLGESKSRLEAALKVISAVSGDEVFFIATCNALTSIPPELKRRFRMGVWYFDLPPMEERAPIWDLYLKKYDIPEQPRPPDEGWTGADIRSCCENAWMLNCSLIEASQFVVPISRSSPDTVKKLREQASGRFLSASYPGTYQNGGRPAAPGEGETMRKIEFE